MDNLYSFLFTCIVLVNLNFFVQGLPKPIPTLSSFSSTFSLSSFYLSSSKNSTFNSSSSSYPPLSLLFKNLPTPCYFLSLFGALQTIQCLSSSSTVSKTSSSLQNNDINQCACDNISGFVKEFTNRILITEKCLPGLNVSLNQTNPKTDQTWNVMTLRQSLVFLSGGANFNDSLCFSWESNQVKVQSPTQVFSRGWSGSYFSGFFVLLMIFALIRLVENKSNT